MRSVILITRRYDHPKIIRYYYLEGESIRVDLEGDLLGNCNNLTTTYTSIEDIINDPAHSVIASDKKEIDKYLMTKELLK